MTLFIRLHPKASVMKLWKYSGTYLSFTGVIHTVYSLITGWEIYRSMLEDGIVDSGGKDYASGFGF